MAKAFKCDRCGTLYEKKKVSRKIVIHSNEQPFTQTKDVCDKCLASFYEWWKNGN